MRFELTEPNKQFSTSELIEDLTRVSHLTGKISVSISEYKNLGNYSYQTLKKRFGSWEAALSAASLAQGKRSWGGDLSEIKIPEEKLIADMLAVSKKNRRGVNENF
jgi:Homing endonuclease associated repeat